MKRIVLVLLLLCSLPSAAIAVSGVGAHVGGSPVKLSPCATNFTRTAPNLCMRTDALSLGVASTACTSISLPDPSAQALVIQYQLIVNGQNTLNATDTVTYQTSSVSNCATIQARGIASVKEFAAINNLQIMEVDGLGIFPVVGGAIWEIVLNAGGAGSAAARQIRGYYDK